MGLSDTIAKIEQVFYFDDSIKYLVPNSLEMHFIKQNVYSQQGHSTRTHTTNPCKPTHKHKCKHNRLQMHSNTCLQPYINLTDSLILIYSLVIN